MIDDVVALYTTNAHIGLLAETYLPDWQERSYNIYTADELAALCPRIPILDVLASRGIQADRFCVMQPDYLVGLNGVFDDEHLEMIKAYLLGSVIAAAAPFGDMTSAKIIAEASAMLSGAAGEPPIEITAYSYTKALASELLGHVYGKLFFGEETRAAAIAKIDAMAVKIGYPDYAEFFLSWAGAWANVVTSEAASISLRTDVHSPEYLRCNVVTQQFQEFYDTFGVEEGDFMFVSEEERLKVW